MGNANDYADGGGKASPTAPDTDARSKGQPESTGFSSALDPAQQSGVPLNEDKAAGVEKGTVPAPPSAPEVAKTPGL